MKNAPLFILFFILNFLNTYSQKKVCEAPKEEIVDLNEISIKKCDVDKKNTRIISKTNITRKRVNNRARKKADHLNTNGNIVKKNSSNSKEVLFTLVEEIPMFESCKKIDKETDIKCFKQKINDHISKNLYAEDYIPENSSIKVYIQFSIDVYGKITDSQIRSRQNNQRLHKELDRIIKKLPRFNPGKEKGLPVIVSYAFPLNLTSN
ncbi:energy transducer TonB [Tenacibaculum piscium]|uniref:energy transducer TonB n=1 Tax=Tenacibaculum piscium TaxID=1458515 RepID=UPI001F479A0A|nr:energy transducer TonB [Tenacibaculum piscium]